MNVQIIYHPQSDHSRIVEDYAHDFSRQLGHDIELVSLESRDGAMIAKMYDIVRYPAILATDNNGVMLKAWQGPVMPLMNESSFYVKD
jgi:hypothetical protein